MAKKVGCSPPEPLESIEQLAPRLQLFIETRVYNFPSDSLQQILPAMRQQKRGTILLTGGGLALHPDSHHISLVIGKSAIRSLTFSLAQQLAEAGIHIATVTISVIVQAGTHFDPDAIAQSYLALHQQPPGAFEPESVYQ